MRCCLPAARESLGSAVALPSPGSGDVFQRAGARLFPVERRPFEIMCETASEFERRGINPRLEIERLREILGGQEIMLSPQPRDREVVQPDIEMPMEFGPKAATDRRLVRARLRSAWQGGSAVRRAPDQRCETGAPRSVPAPPASSSAVASAWRWRHAGPLPGRHAGPAPGPAHRRSPTSDCRHAPRRPPRRKRRARRPRHGRPRPPGCRQARNGRPARPRSRGRPECVRLEARRRSLDSANPSRSFSTSSGSGR